MTINPEVPKLATHPTSENRNSKLETRRADQFRILNLEVGPLLMLIALGLGGIHPANATERVWERRFALPTGGSVSVVNMQGSVLVEGWDRSEVEASVAMRSATPTDQIDDVQVAVEARPGGVSFHTLYPSGLDNPIRVDYRLRVPRQVRLNELSTLDGDIIVHNIEGSMKARSLHGDIQGIDVAGAMTANALTGNILISLRSIANRTAPIQLATINGNVDLLLPAHANASLELSTVAGNILGNYAFQVSEVPGDSTRRAQVGAGGPRVVLHTVRGNISVGERQEDL
jgi:hypothetical protein